MRLRELLRWTVTTSADGRRLIVLVVDDAGDEELLAAVAHEDRAPSERFAGTWRAGERDGESLISFLLVEEADPGLERAWWTTTYDRALLEAASKTPHQVVVVPHTRADGDGVLVDVDHPSVRVAELLAALPDG
jgi:hypothetical protein